MHLSIDPRSSRSTAALPALALLIAVWLAAAAAPAWGGEYTLAACDRLNQGYGDAVFDRGNGGDYAFGKFCDQATEGNSLLIKNISGAPSGRFGKIQFLAPAGTAMVAASGEANLRRDEGHRARVSFLNPSVSEAGRIATGTGEQTGFEPFSARIGDRAGFEAALTCDTNPSCPQSDRAHVRIRSLRLSFADRIAPTVGLGGSLISSGWIRGGHDLGVALADQGSGVRRLEMTINERTIPQTQTFGCATVPGSPLVSAARPCELQRSVGASFATTEAPFVNGPNVLVACARDYGGDANQTCNSHRVLVDNLPPSVALQRPSREDPELIVAAVGDAHSGPATAAISYRPVAGGEWRSVPTTFGADGRAEGRVDSSSEPRGRYLFRIEATDIAGNGAASTQTADGTELVLDFPLRERSRVSAMLKPAGKRLGYGSRPTLRGRLQGGDDGSGPGGLAGESVEVIERMESGASTPTHIHTVKTDGNGRFKLRLVAGPSRKVEVRYSGSRRYLPAQGPTRKLDVLGHSTLRISGRKVRAGKRVRFRGRVGLLGAEVPSRGKVVELQVRERGDRRYRTVRQALHSNGRGQLKTSYRFARFYQRPVVFQFRLRVTPQARWPYRAPANSKPRSLKVLPR